MQYRITALLSLLLAACTSQQRQPAFDVPAAVGALNAELESFANASNLSNSRFEIHGDCQTILVTRWSTQAASRKGFASARTEVPVNFSTVRAIDFSGPRSVADARGVQSLDAGIRMDFLVAGVRMKTTAVLASNSQERSAEFETDFVEISVAQDATAADASVRSLMTKLREVQTACKAR
ncbi:hypothetical protein [Roseateles sp.]|uniref:hypothetical protein n=1 Tax=Roseateles sp. TaxID=1971397 RepID=UPI003D12D656